MHPRVTVRSHLLSVYATAQHQLQWPRQQWVGAAYYSRGLKHFATPLRASYCCLLLPATSPLHCLYLPGLQSRDCHSVVPARRVCHYLLLPAAACYCLLIPCVSAWPAVLGLWSRSGGRAGRVLVQLRPGTAGGAQVQRQQQQREPAGGPAPGGRTAQLQGTAHAGHAAGHQPAGWGRRGGQVRGGEGGEARSGARNGGQVRGG